MGERLFGRKTFWARDLWVIDSLVMVLWVKDLWVMVLWVKDLWAMVLWASIMLGEGPLAVHHVG